MESESRPATSMPALRSTCRSYFRLCPIFAIDGSAKTPENISTTFASDGSAGLSFAAAPPKSKKSCSPVDGAGSATAPPAANSGSSSAGAAGIFAGRATGT